MREGTKKTKLLVGFPSGRSTFLFLLTNYWMDTKVCVCVCVCRSDNPDAPLLKCKVSTWSVGRRQVLARSLRRRFRLPKSAGSGQSAFEWTTAGGGGLRGVLIGEYSIFGHLIRVSSCVRCCSVKPLLVAAETEEEELACELRGDFSSPGAQVCHTYEWSP